MSRCARPGCDLDEDEHHAFVAVKMPDGCKCDGNDWWVRPIPAVCPAYTEGDEDPGCKNCGHDLDCHAPKTEPQKNETEGP